MFILRSIYSGCGGWPSICLVAALAGMAGGWPTVRAADRAAETAAAAQSADTTQRLLQTGWAKPARTYKPHTRWWWPGNALTQAEITWQLEQMAWMAPHRLDVSRAIRVGKNRLVVFVTNTLINYVTGLKTPSEVPVELQPRLGQANPALYEHSGLAKREMSENDLPPSGLLGPVRIVCRPIR